MEKRLKIGIPRALLYYWYGHIWEQFWHHSGCEVKTSPATNPKIMKAGIESAVDELCLPIKIFLGHVITLVDYVDFIMIPHLIQVQKDEFICPKFMGLPDIVNHAIPSSRGKLLTVRMSARHLDIIDSLSKSAQQLGISPGKLQSLRNQCLDTIYKPALDITQALQSEVLESSGLSIGLLGHPYCLYDACLNLNLLKILRQQNVLIYTPEMMPKKFFGIGSGKLSKDLFWTIGKMQFDALDWLIQEKGTQIDGFIHIAPFACGPEAIVSDMISRRIHNFNKPSLMLNYEEQSGEAGIVTRVEAFVDLIKYQHIAC
jgi:predicted nucleotide-binding protein (sugar kinase/HSP70/actin superfamily)